MSENVENVEISQEALEAYIPEEEASDGED